MGGDVEAMRVGEVTEGGAEFFEGEAEQRLRVGDDVASVTKHFEDSTASQVAAAAL